MQFLGEILFYYFNDVCRLETFWALLNGELNFLAFIEGFKTLRFDCREMYEHVWAILAFNEALSLACIEPFNSTCHPLPHLFLLLALLMMISVAFICIPLVHEG